MREASTMDYGSFNFHGPVSKVLAKASTLVTLALVGVVLHAARTKASGDVANETDEERAQRTWRIVLATLATMTALWLGGKVFSPQYLTWALPLVIAVPGRGWKQIALLLGVILAVSQLYLRGFYDHVYNQWPVGVVTMVFRLALLGRVLRGLPACAARVTIPRNAESLLLRGRRRGLRLRGCGGARRLLGGGRGGGDRRGGRGGERAEVDGLVLPEEAEVVGLDRDRGDAGGSS